jgi:cysteinyl-tRNA synthetase
MSSKYLGTHFDIHGGGMDLIPTHHTNEVAQHLACFHQKPVNYWIHTNMLTVNGQKMSKSLGNSFLPHELFTGNHPLLDKGYSPMVVRFFMLQAHYRSTIDFSNEALQAAEKGFSRLMNACKLLAGLPVSTESEIDATAIKEQVYESLNEDFNTPLALAALFEGVRAINAVQDAKLKIDEKNKAILVQVYSEIVFDVLGLQAESSQNEHIVDGIMQMVLEQRKLAKQRKDFSASDAIRDQLKALGIEVKDGKEGSTYHINS